MTTTALAPPVSRTALTRRAGLTFVSDTLSQFALLAIGLVVTPAIVAALGDVQYGIWVIINNAVGYITAVDLRTGSTLRFTLGTKQHDDDHLFKQRQIGAAIIAWIAVLPLFGLIGLMLVWFVPSLTQTPPTLIGITRLSMAMLVGYIVIERLLSLPANILRGLNLEYRAMGLNAFVTACGGGLSLLALWWGWGMPGLVLAMIGASALNAFSRSFIAKRSISWLRVSIPRKDEVRQFLGFSGWLLLASLGNTLLFANQYIIIGVMMGPVLAAIYAATGAAVNLSATVVRRILDSADAGIAEIVGREEWARLEAVRAEVQILSLGTMFILGACIVSLNQSFVGLWLGDRLYGGRLLTLVLVLMTMLQMIFRADAFISMAMKRVRQASVASAVTGVICAGTASALGAIWGLNGLAVGALFSFVGLTVYYRTLIASVTHHQTRENLLPLIRVAIPGSMLLGAAWAVSPLLRTSNWLIFGGEALLLVLVYGAYVWFACFNRQQRTVIITRFAQLRRRRRDATVQ